MSTSTIPLISPTDIVNHYDLLVRRSGIKTAGLVDIAQAATGRIKRHVGYSPEQDKDTGLPSITEVLDGGRPVVFLKAQVDLATTGSDITVTELGVALARRTSFPSLVGDYFVDDSGYMLYRLNGKGVRTLGIWGANSTADVPTGTFGNTALGGVRQEGDYTANYRGIVTVTYNPAVDMALFKSVALKLCRIELLDRIAATSVSVGDKSYSYMQTSLQGDTQEILAQLPQPIWIATGG